MEGKQKTLPGVEQVLGERNVWVSHPPKKIKGKKKAMQKKKRKVQLKQMLASFHPGLRARPSRYPKAGPAQESLPPGRPSQCEAERERANHLVGALS